MTHEEFKLALESLKLTPAQKKIANKIAAGYRIIHVNQHQRSGGSYHWTRDGDDEVDIQIEYAGKVYTAFWNISYALENAGFPKSMNFAFHPNNDVRV
jgi:hypothetical protein